MKKITVNERRIDDVLILDLEGNIRLGDDCSEFRRVIRFLVEKGEKKILLNVAHVEYVDSSGLGELVAGYINLQKNNGEMRLINLTPKIRDLMVLTKLLTIFDIYDSEAEAVESFKIPSLKSSYIAA